MKFSVKFDLKQVQRYATDIQKKYIPAAAGIALGRVANTVRATSSTKIRERLAIAAAVAKKAIRVQRIGKKFEIWIVASGKPIALKDYQARQTRKGATYRVSKNKGRKVYSRQGRVGFIIPSKGGHVFVRTEDDPPGPMKGHIQKVYGPSVPQYFVTKIVNQAMRNTAMQRWPIEFAAAFRGVILRRTGSDIGSSLAGLGS
jgi:hypothetical protein